uniref:Uncharacterized protein n=1 Tax=Nicotiana tabacum TaxID=4097 RepID=A0A1S4B8D2_TOBAC
MMKFLGDESSSSCFQIDLLDDLVDEYKDNQLISDSLERCLARSGTISDDNPIIREQAEILEKESENEKVSQGVQLKIELKELPSNLKYVFLELELFPVIISSSLTIEQESKLIEVLRKYKRALGWTIADIKGISPAICMHSILMENDYKPIVQHQRRLNPAMQEVVKKEMMKLLAAGHGFYCFLDGYSRYNHIPIAPEDQEKTTFTCPQDNYRKAFEILKKQLTNAPIVISPNWSEPFEIMCDESDIAVGAILGQKRDKIFRPIYYVDDIIRRCVPKKEINILSHCHDGAVGGHYGGRKTTAKVLEVGFLWPTLFKDARNYVATCDKCQRI